MDGTNTPIAAELEEEERDLFHTEEEIKLNEIDGHICADLFERLNAFQMLAQSDADLEMALTARINCLSQTKVLVTIHGKSVFLLVVAHTELGEAYLALKRYQ